MVQAPTPPSSSVCGAGQRAVIKGVTSGRHRWGATLSLLVRACFELHHLLHAAFVAAGGRYGEHIELLFQPGNS